MVEGEDNGFDLVYHFEAETSAFALFPVWNLEMNFCLLKKKLENFTHCPEPHLSKE